MPALKAAKDLIRWYENEQDRYEHDEEDLPEELIELEKDYNEAIEALEQEQRR